MGGSAGYVKILQLKHKQTIRDTTIVEHFFKTRMKGNPPINVCVDMGQSFAKAMMSIDKNGEMPFRSIHIALYQTKDYVEWLRESNPNRIINVFIVMDGIPTLFKHQKNPKRGYQTIKYTSNSTTFRCVIRSPRFDACCAATFAATGEIFKEYDNNNNNINTNVIRAPSEADHFIQSMPYSETTLVVSFDSDYVMLPVSRWIICQAGTGQLTRNEASTIDVDVFNECLAKELGLNKSVPMNSQGFTELKVTFHVVSGCDFNKIFGVSNTIAAIFLRKFLHENPNRLSKEKFEIREFLKYVVDNHNNNALLSKKTDAPVGVDAATTTENEEEEEEDEEEECEDEEEEFEDEQEESDDAALTSPEELANKKMQDDLERGFTYTCSAVTYNPSTKQTTIACHPAGKQCKEWGPLMHLNDDTNLFNIEFNKTCTIIYDKSTDRYTTTILEKQVVLFTKNNFNFRRNKGQNGIKHGDSHSIGYLFTYGYLIAGPCTEDIDARQKTLVERQFVRPYHLPLTLADKVMSELSVALKKTDGPFPLVKVELERHSSKYLWLAKSKTPEFRQPSNWRKIKSFSTSTESTNFYKKKYNNSNFLFDLLCCSRVHQFELFLEYYINNKKNEKMLEYFCQQELDYFEDGAEEWLEMIKPIRNNFDTLVHKILESKISSDAEIHKIMKPSASLDHITEFFRLRSFFFCCSAERTARTEFKHRSSQLVLLIIQSMRGEFKNQQEATWSANPYREIKEMLKNHPNASAIIGDFERSGKKLNHDTIHFVKNFASNLLIWIKDLTERAKAQKLLESLPPVNIDGISTKLHNVFLPSLLCPACMIKKGEGRTLHFVNCSYCACIRALIIHTLASPQVAAEESEEMKNILVKREQDRVNQQNQYMKGYYMQNREEMRKYGRERWRKFKEQIQQYKMKWWELKRDEINRLRRENRIQDPEKNTKINEQNRIKRQNLTSEQKEDLRKRQKKSRDKPESKKKLKEYRKGKKAHIAQRTKNWRLNMASEKKEQMKKKKNAAYQKRKAGMTAEEFKAYNKEQKEKQKLAAAAKQVIDAAQQATRRERESNGVIPKNTANARKIMEKRKLAKAKSKQPTVKQRQTAGKARQQLPTKRKETKEEKQQKGRERRAKNREKYLQQKKKSYEKHREKINKKRRADYDEHKEEIKKTRKADYDEHKEEINKKRRADYDEHKEEIKKTRKADYDEHKEEINKKRRADYEKDEPNEKRTESGTRRQRVPEGETNEITLKETKVPKNTANARKKK